MGDSLRLYQPVTQSCPTSFLMCVLCISASLYLQPECLFWDSEFFPLVGIDDDSGGNRGIIFSTYTNSLVTATLILTPLYFESKIIEKVNTIQNSLEESMLHIRKRDHIRLTNIKNKLDKVRRYNKKRKNTRMEMSKVHGQIKRQSMDLQIGFLIFIEEKGTNKQDGKTILTDS